MGEVKLYSEVALARSVRGTNLKTGDVAVLADVVRHPHGGEAGAVLEVFNSARWRVNRRSHRTHVLP